MENFIKEHDYAILVYAKEDTAKYTAAIKALTETKKMSGWDRVQGVTIHKDCRIPSLYHGGRFSNSYGEGQRERAV